MLYNPPAILETKTQDMKNKFHNPVLSQNQCGSTLIKTIDAPLPLVWSIIRQFDKPQAYKRFVRSCTMLVGNGACAGSIREVMLISGLPSEFATERLDRLDDDLYVMIVSIIGGDDRLVNYQSTITLHEIEEERRSKTVVIESYAVDVPEDSCKEDTCVFADTIVRCNLASLATISQTLAGLGQRIFFI